MASVLGKSMGRFFPGRGPIGDRNAALRDWVHARSERGLWPYGLVARTPHGTSTTIRHPSGAEVHGVNLTTVDYLGLSQHPALRHAAIAAIEEYGVHTPSSGPLMGSSDASFALEAKISRLLGIPSVFLAPTGWAAAFTALAGIVRDEDHVVMDCLAHQCLQQAAYASTPHVQLARHLDVEHVEELLAKIRAEHPKAGVLVVTEGLFSMDGDAPDFRALAAVARRYDALTLVDVAHDLGAMGPGGGGTLGAQDVLAEIDIVAGSFSKTFGTNGGFVASRDPNIFWAQVCFGGPYTYSTAMSPVQVAVASAAIDLVIGAEGDARRRTLMENVAYTRSGAERRGLTLIGAPSPIVPVLIGSESKSRLAGRASFEAGLLATCLEFPVVPRGSARYRLSLSPLFTHDELDGALDIIRASLNTADRLLHTPAAHAGAA